MYVIQLTFEPFRIDVYVSGQYIPPLNKNPDETSEQKFFAPTYHCQYCPTPNSDNGANYQVLLSNLLLCTLPPLIPATPLAVGGGN